MRGIRIRKSPSQALQRSRRAQIRKGYREGLSLQNTNLRNYPRHIKGIIAELSGEFRACIR